MVVRLQIDRFDEYIPHPEYLKLLLRATDATTTGMKDFSGYGRVITAYADTTGSTTQKKINPYSIKFDGTGDYLTAPTSNDFSFDKDFTISFWVYRNATQTGTLNYGIIATHTYNKTGLCVVDEGTSWYIMANGSIVITISRVTNEIWNHVVLSRNGSSMKIFVNGVEKGSATVSASLTNTGIIVATQFSYLDHTFAGYIDELMIWKGIAIPIEELYPQRKPFSFRRA